ncbi:hypothetical protein DFH27DRAFT_562294 [Peziza echinospora]|nr:hypothetical protein DFH27DRAFT_562294 [Peziza echinospora]
MYSSTYMYGVPQLACTRVADHRGSRLDHRMKSPDMRYTYRCALCMHRHLYPGHENTSTFVYLTFSYSLTAVSYFFIPFSKQIHWPFAFFFSLPACICIHANPNLTTHHEKVSRYLPIAS